LLALTGQGASKIPSHVDPDAAKILDEMVKTYRSIGKLRQETIYGAGEGKPPRMIRSSLTLARPNRIVLEMLQPAVDREKPYRLLYHCDGRDLYAYQETKGFYAKEKAPKSLKELDYLAVSLEMSAITGGDPAPQLFAQSRAVKLAEPDLVDAVNCDVVVCEMGSIDRTTTLRLSIGQKDHLLRKFDYASIPVPKPEPEKPKDKIIVGDPNDAPAPEAKPEEPIRMTYENHVFPERDLPKDVFKWSPPAGSFQYQDYPSLLNPRATGAIKPTAGLGTPNGMKPMKIIPFEQLMKEAWKKQRQRR
jgi:hypothetical protein